MLLGEQTGCKVFGAPSGCPSDPKPKCTPFRSVDYCPTDESFQTYIQARSSFVAESPAAVDNTGYWFPHLDDKLASYKVSAALGLNPPTIYHCTDDMSTIKTFEPPAGVNGFVVRATDLHSNFGIYVLPNGFGQPELISGVNMTAADIEADMSKLSSEKVVIEEYVGASDSLPMEFKFHMFDGQVASVNVVANRGSSCACKFENYVDILAFSIYCYRMHIFVQINSHQFHFHFVDDHC